MEGRHAVNLDSDVVGYLRLIRRVRGGAGLGKQAFAAIADDRVRVLRGLTIRLS